MKAKVISKNDCLNEAYWGDVFMGGQDSMMGPSQFNVQGSSLVPVYAILPITDELQQKPNEVDDSMYIHPGSLVRGQGFNNPNKHYTGRVVRIVKDGDGSVLCLYVRTLKTCKHVCVSPDNLELITFEAPTQTEKIVMHDEQMIQHKYAQ